LLLLENVFTTLIFANLFGHSLPKIQPASRLDELNQLSASTFWECSQSRHCFVRNFGKKRELIFKRLATFLLNSTPRFWSPSNKMMTQRITLLSRVQIDRNASLVD
jgi:hypothetical protein